MRIHRTTPRYIDFMSPANPHGLRFAEGDGGDTGGGTPPAGDGQGDGQGPAGQPNSPQGTQTPTPADIARQKAGDSDSDGDGQGGDQPGKVEDLPSWAQKIINEARDGEAKARLNAKQTAAEEARKELLSSIAPALKALGIDVPGGDQAPDPEALVTQAQAKAEEAERARVDLARELAIFRGARDAGVDPDKVLDSRSAMTTLADVDPTDGKALTDALRKLAEGNPQLRARAAGASSIDAPGGTGDRRNIDRHVTLEQGAASVYGLR